MKKGDRVQVEMRRSAKYGTVMITPDDGAWVWLVIDGNSRPTMVQTERVRVLPDGHVARRLA